MEQNFSVLLPGNSLYKVVRLERRKVPLSLPGFADLLVPISVLTEIPRYDFSVYTVIRNIIGTIYH